MSSTEALVYVSLGGVVVMIGYGALIAYRLIRAFLFYAWMDDDG